LQRSYKFSVLNHKKLKIEKCLEGVEAGFIHIKNGETNIAVNIGSHVLRNSFDKNDPKGFYQATLSLTESDI